MDRLFLCYVFRVIPLSFQSTAYQSLEIKKPSAIDVKRIDNYTVSRYNTNTSKAGRNKHDKQSIFI